MADAILRSGEPEKIDYTAGADIAEGQVMIVGTVAANTGFTAIAERPIANGDLGSLAIGGCWDVINLDNAANGAKVWWNNSSKKATTTSTSNATLGWIVQNGSGGANSTCRVMHRPFPTA